MTDPVTRALAYLSRVVEPPCPRLVALVARVGAIEAADRVKRRAVDDQLVRATEARHEIECAASDLAVLERLGGRLVSAVDTEWPLLAFTAFAGVDTKQRPEAHPPLALWVRGPARLDEVAERAAAIVGTRAATAYGEHVAAELAAGLAGRDAAVVSGGAYGIDGAAHRAALAMPRCSTGSVSRACLSPNTRPASDPPGTASLPETGSSQRFRERQWWWRPVHAAARPTPRRGHGHWDAGSARCRVRSPRRRP